MMRNPVMFVLELGSVLNTVLLLVNITTHTGDFRFGVQITLWLWFTVLFANFAETMAEGRGKAQAEALRQAKSETTAYRLDKGGGGFDLTQTLANAGVANVPCFTSRLVESRSSTSTSSILQDFMLLKRTFDRASKCHRRWAGA